ncbi:hypothetical protein [Riemerella columbina]|uniref:hypothetical protein n=1 Tax=Riemerella columbina TaxID=103810 RepID=UPI002670AD6F|nr:hypothetical protein [Riemerella columbina]WKS94736.1 hypothetical protein NYR17_07320 [Riemerella columbina]
MSTAIIQAEVNTKDIPLLEALLKKFKAKSIKVEEKDPAKMSKEEYEIMLENSKKVKK